MQINNFRVKYFLEVLLLTIFYLHFLLIINLRFWSFHKFYNQVYVDGNPISKYAIPPRINNQELTAIKLPSLGIDYL